MAELLSSAEIKQYLRELAEVLGDSGSPQEIIVVGGALLAHYGIREGTRDVDSVLQLDEELKAAAAKVAERHGLAPDWLNAKAAAFRPATLDESQCEEILNHGRFLVLAAPINQVFLMKLNSNRATDQADLVLAWDYTSFEDVDDVISAYDDAFPAAPEDAFLDKYVASIIEEATRA